MLTKVKLSSASEGDVYTPTKGAGMRLLHGSIVAQNRIKEVAAALLMGWRHKSDSLEKKVAEKWISATDEGKYDVAAAECLLSVLPNLIWKHLGEPACSRNQ